jgi:ABC-2 type transport system permease protein
VLLLLVPVFLGINVFLLLAGGTAAYISGLGSLLVISFFCLVFYGLCTLLGITVSAVAGSSGHAMIILLACWIMGSFILPRANTYLAQQLYPTPSGIAFTRQVNHDKANGLNGQSNEEQKAQFVNELLQKYKVASLEELPVGYAGLSLQNGEDLGNKIFNKHYGTLHRQFQHQNQVMAAGAFFSPVVALRQLLMGFAGTDVDHQIAFTNQAENHRRLMQRRINAHYARIAKGKETGREVNQELWRQIPPFQYTEVSLISTIKNQYLNILALLSWVFIIGSGAYYVVNKKLSC